MNVQISLNLVEAGTVLGLESRKECVRARMSVAPVAIFYSSLLRTQLVQNEFYCDVGSVQIARAKPSCSWTVYRIPVLNAQERSIYNGFRADFSKTEN
jgi:hypothetical protein